MRLEVGALLGVTTLTSLATSVNNRLFRAINQAKDRVLSDIRMLGMKSTTFSTVSSQFLYEPVEDLGHILSLRQYTTPTKLQPIDSALFYEKVPDPSNNGASGTPTYYVTRLGLSDAGFNQIGLYPVPDAAITMYLTYRMLMRDFANDDYETGTITFTNGDATIAGSGTTFTAAMVGRYIKDGNGYWYKIKTFTNTTSMELEKDYVGTTEAGVTTHIAERFALMGQEDSADYAIATYAKYLITLTDRNHIELAALLKAEYDTQIRSLRSTLNSDLDDLLRIAPDNFGTRNSFVHLPYQFDEY
jgi:hypothetical protein